MEASKMAEVRNRFFPAMLLSMAFAAAAAAQAVPFSMQYTQGPITVGVENNSALTVAAPLGQSQTLLIRATYGGTGTATISQMPIVLGSPAFTSTINQSLPFTLNPGQSFVFTVRYAPGSPTVETADLTVPFAETPASTVSPISLTLRGVTSAIVLSYTLPEDNNVISLQPNDAIPFPNTLLGSSSPATLSFTNIGTSPGQITRVSLSGADFRLQGLPLFPYTLIGGQTLNLQVIYRPTAAGDSAGTISVETVGAAPVTIRLTGQAVAPTLSYEAGTPPAAIPSGGTISLPGVDVGQSSASLVRIVNTGSGPATINTVSAIGQGFTIPVPPTLPQTIAPGGSLTFTLSFTPTRTGSHTGTLAVNSDVLNLSGNGLGASLGFSYVTGNSTINLGPGNTAIIFSPVRVSESAQISLDIKNLGSGPALIQNIGIGQVNTAFSIINPPVLPATLAPNATLRVIIKFEPAVAGFTNTTLIVDNTTLSLVGSGTQPPALPAYTLSGPSGTVAPLTQPNVGLKLATAYPVALTGVLTLAPASGNLPSDPAVQFATGGRTVNFRIPANSTDAIFGAQGTQVGLQTGTVAGTFTLTPSFATQAGNIDVTPTAPVISQFAVASVAPTLLSAQVVNASATGFTIQVTGFTTTRTLTSLGVQFTTASGFKMPTSQFTVDAKSIAAAWFQSAASQAFGGQFRVSIPFSFTLPAGQSVLTGISGISVTATNEAGASAALQTKVQ